MKNFSSSHASDTSVGAVLRVKKIASASKKALLANDMENLGRLLDLNWKEKKLFSALVSNSSVEGFYEELKRAGAIGGKLLGAGGGGHMLFVCPLFKKIEIINKATELGAEHIDYDFVPHGLVTWRG